MSITFIEAWEREIAYGTSGGTITVPLTALGSSIEQDVYAAALLYSPPRFLGNIRNNIRVTALGGPVMKVEVQYGTTGVGGGNQPLGGEDGSGGTPATPSGPASDSAPLTSDFSFSIVAPTLHITQSLETISKTRRGGGVPIDFKGAIGVGQDGRVEGVDLPPGQFLSWQRTVARGSVSTAYLITLSNLAGKVSNASFYTFDEGTLFYMGADGQYTPGAGWSITHKFLRGQNDINIVICEDLVVPSKKAFEYLWTAYREVLENGLITTVPAQANVEKVLEVGNFSLLEIGV